MQKILRLLDAHGLDLPMYRYLVRRLHLRLNSTLGKLTSHSGNRRHVPTTKSSGTNKMIMKKQIKLELYLQKGFYMYNRLLDISTISNFHQTEVLTGQQKRTRKFTLFTVTTCISLQCTSVDQTANAFSMKNTIEEKKDKRNFF